jgi:hypothetical protein
LTNESTSLNSLLPQKVLFCEPVIYAYTSISLDMYAKNVPLEENSSQAQDNKWFIEMLAG